ncbi:uncharacterized protein PG998_008703 [Apiospora kogelbergensis]|uniref:uncharacterized protein n=1 Tax=Apiospora kogelbergensis TaxID=1337665 RepID=UPI003130F2A2
MHTSTLTVSRSSTRAQHGSVSYEHSTPLPSSNKKKSEKKGRKHSKTGKQKKQNEALLGAGSQFDDGNYQGDVTGADGYYPQDLAID